MKNLFTINLDAEDEGFSPEFNALKSREVGSDTSKRLENNAEKYMGLLKKSYLPMPLLIIKYIFLVLGVCILSVTLTTCAEMGEANKTVYIFLAVGIAFLVGFIILYTISKYKEALVMNSEEYKNALAMSDSLEKSSKFELGIPDNAYEIDFFAWTYKTENGEIKKGASDVEYEPCEMYVFAENGYLCMADLHTVYKIAPLDSFKKIEYITRKSSFDFWTKDEDFDSPKYKEYKISSDKYETVYYIKNLCSLQFELNGEEFELIIPPYDIYAIEELTGLHPEYPQDEE